MIRIFVGQIAIGIIALFGLCISIDFYSTDHFPLLAWTICLIGLGVWTFKKPTIAFILTLLFYIVTIGVRYILYDGEYLFLYFVHFYFIVSMIVGIMGGEDMRLRKLEEESE